MDRRGNIVAAVGRITGHPALLSDNTSSHSEPVLSFKGFLRLLCHVALSSPLMPQSSPPRVRLLALLSGIDRCSHITLSLRCTWSAALASHSILSYPILHYEQLCDPCHPSPYFLYTSGLSVGRIQSHIRNLRTLNFDLLNSAARVW